MNVIWTWSVKRIKPEDLPAWEHQMDQPFDFQIKMEPDKEQLESEGQDFLALMNSIGG